MPNMNGIFTKAFGMADGYLNRATGFVSKSERAQRLARGYQNDAMRMKMMFGERTGGNYGWKDAGNFMLGANPTGFAGSGRGASMGSRNFGRAARRIGAVGAGATAGSFAAGTAVRQFTGSGGAVYEGNQFDVAGIPFI